MGGELQQLDEAEQDDGVVGLQERGIGLRRLDDEFFPHTGGDHDDSHEHFEAGMPEGAAEPLQPHRPRQRRAVLDDEQPVLRPAGRVGPSGIVCHPARGGS